MLSLVITHRASGAQRCIFSVSSGRQMCRLHHCRRRRCHHRRFSPPQPPTPIMPKWTHTFAVESTSSDRVRAASVAYLAEQHSNSRNKKTRLTDVYSKKASKQEKYLSIVQASDINSILLTADEIRKEVIVFDGTTSHPPPHISPPRT